MRDLVQIERYKLIVIIRGLNVEKIIKTVEALQAGGIKLIEVTFDQKSPTCVEDTSNVIKELSTRFDDLCIGAGTVLTIEQVEAAYKAGARYIITPNTNVNIIRRSTDLGMVSIPGALTSTEVVEAYEAGAAFVKLFPIVNLGLEYIKAIKAPLNHIPMMAVGGVDLSNMAEFYKAGVCGFGIGGSLVNKHMIETGDFEGLKNLAIKYVEEAERCKKISS